MRCFGSTIGSIGAPYREPPTVEFDPARRAALAGVYQGDGDKEWYLRDEGGSLSLQGKDGPRQTLYAISADEFRTDSLLVRIRVEEDDAGAVSALIVTGRIGVAQRLVRTERPLPEEPTV